jgi:hypothetical protein
MKKFTLFGSVAIVVGLAGCAAMYSSVELDKMSKAVITKSFTPTGQSKMEWLNQDSVNVACTEISTLLRVRRLSRRICGRLKCLLTATS